jgi:hypothetical protein
MKTKKFRGIKIARNPKAIKKAGMRERNTACKRQSSERFFAEFILSLPKTVVELYCKKLLTMLTNGYCNKS